jgi:hypothetical protein
MKLLNNENRLQKNEEYYATLHKHHGIHQKMFEAFPDLLERRDRLITAIATDYEAEQMRRKETIATSERDRMNT